LYEATLAATIDHHSNYFGVLFVFKVVLAGRFVRIQLNVDSSAELEKVLASSRGYVERQHTSFSASTRSFSLSLLVLVMLMKPLHEFRRCLDKDNKLDCSAMNGRLVYIGTGKQVNPQDIRTTTAVDDVDA